MITKIINARVVDGGRISDDPICFDDRILPQGSFAERIIDAGGQFVSAGFIDLHLHGGDGYDFMDGSDDAFRRIAAFHARHGTTAMCPTTLSGDLDETLEVIEAYKRVKAESQIKVTGADFIGLHLEGPYFAYSQRGAQDPKYIHPPRRDEYMRLLDACGDIVRWSSAPELDAGWEFVGELKRRGIMASAGHTDADCRQMLEAAKQGYTHMTHLYSGMKGVERIAGIRVAGAVEAAFLCDDITVEVIADGMHLPHEILALVYKIKGADRTALITDAMRGAGLPDGSETLLGSKQNGQPAIIEQGVAWLPTRDAFAGSVATTDRLVRNILASGITLTDAVKMASETPAKLIGCRNKGRLEVGYDADIVMFDEEVKVSRVFIRGEELL